MFLKNLYANTRTFAHFNHHQNDESKCNFSVVDYLN